jgi:hypothetical protein
MAQRDLSRTTARLSFRDCPMSEAPAMASESSRQLLRHTVATLAYRAEKVLRDIPPEFADFRPSPASRTPLQILLHLSDLLEWAERLARGEYRWQPGVPTDWQAALDRFFQGLAALDAALDDPRSASFPAEVIFQGPIADALTHVGQLAMLRGMAGVPLRPESYARAEIRVGRLGREQAWKRVEFDGDASAPASRSGKS